MANYKSESIAWWAFALAGLLLMAAVGACIFEGPDEPPVAVVAAGLALGASVIASFGVLTVRVTQKEVTWRFGIGPFSKRVALHRIRHVEPRRSPWYWGWGIRWTPSGWLWRAHGLDAVWLERDSGKWIGVGTADPEGLTRAIRGAAGLTEPA